MLCFIYLNIYIMYYYKYNLSIVFRLAEKYKQII